MTEVVTGQPLGHSFKLCGAHGFESGPFRVFAAGSLSRQKRARSSWPEQLSRNMYRVTGSRIYTTLVVTVFAVFVILGARTRVGVYENTYLAERTGCEEDTFRNRVERIFLVREEHVYRYFEDWVNPLLNSLSLFVPVETISFESANVTVFTGSDVIFVLQCANSLRLQPEAEYWFMNTEGMDKKFAEEAFEQGFENFVDFTLKGVERLSELGGKRVLWLPIVYSPGMHVHLERTRLCMIGPANTKRRVRFVEELQAHISRQENRIDFRHIEGWSADRDFESQRCSLVVHLGSTDVNKLVARLRLDLLWLHDIPVISESALEPDVSEYMGTVQFVSLTALVEETVKMWHILRADSEAVHSLSAYKTRLEILAKRRNYVQKLIRVVLRMGHA